jgi:hypothetical protein
VADGHPAWRSDQGRLRPVRGQAPGPLGPGAHGSARRTRGSRRAVPAARSAGEAGRSAQAERGALHCQGGALSQDLAEPGPAGTPAPPGGSGAARPRQADPARGGRPGTVTAADRGDPDAGQERRPHAEGSRGSDADSGRASSPGHTPDAGTDRRGSIGAGPTDSGRAHAGPGIASIRSHGGRVGAGHSSDTRRAGGSGYAVTGRACDAATDHDAGSVSAIARSRADGGRTTCTGAVDARGGHSVTGAGSAPGSRACAHPGAHAIAGVRGLGRLGGSGLAIEGTSVARTS